MSSSLSSQNTLSEKELKTLIKISQNNNRATLFLAQLIQSFKIISRDNSAVVSASEELNFSIKEISNNVENVSTDATTAENIISQSIIAADNAINTMNEIAITSSEATAQIDTLADTSKNIIDILKTIDNISKQTHLLALNATIEAARAGEAGKGFTVVAKEVKNLAEQASKATESIKLHTEKLSSDMSKILHITERNATIVNEGQQQISDTVALLKDSAENVKSVNYKMHEVSSILQQQSIATKEISENITNVSKSTNDNIEFAKQGANSAVITGEIIKSEVKSINPASVTDKAICELTKLDHLLFKKMIIDTLLGISNFTSADLPNHHSCRLGKWYDNITNPKLKNSDAFKKLDEPHHLVHKYGAEALDYFNKNNLEGTMNALDKLEENSLIVFDCLTKIAELL